jgi:small-conductance mechanosensitive channel
MFGIPLPWLLVGLCITLFGTYRGGYHFGWSDRDKEMQIEIARKNEEARQTEQKLTEQINTTATKLQETTNAVNQKQTDLNRLIAAGRVRLPTPSCVQAPTSPAPAPTNSPETRSEPDRQADQASDAERATLQAIAEIVAQGDKNTAQLNACIDAYNDVRNLLNGNK